MSTFHQIDKATCGFIDAFNSENDDDNFSHYLYHNGSYDQLIVTIRQLEEEDEKFLLSDFLVIDNTHKLFEIPTKELCIFLTQLFKLLGVDAINEVASGSGLLSAMLKMYLKLNIVTSDKYSNLFGISRTWSYVPVLDKSFDDLTSYEIVGKPLIISWMHSSSEIEFLRMIDKLCPSMVIHVGEHNGCCYGLEFKEKMHRLGYTFFYLVPVKMISKMDYFKHNTIYAKCKTIRSCTTIFSKTEIPILGDNMLLHFDENLFGTYENLTDEYALQDITVFNKIHKMKGGKQVSVTPKRHTIDDFFRIFSQPSEFLLSPNYSRASHITQVIGRSNRMSKPQKFLIKTPISSKFELSCANILTGTYLPCTPHIPLQKSNNLAIVPYLVHKKDQGN